MKLRLTKQFTFEMAHALPLYEGKCHNIHGHSYKLFVTVEGDALDNLSAEGDMGEFKLPDTGMVMDFSQIKKIERGSAYGFNRPSEQRRVVPSAVNAQEFDICCPTAMLRRMRRATVWGDTRRN